MNRMFIILCILLGTSITFLISAFAYSQALPVLPEQPEAQDLFEMLKWLVLNWKTGGWFAMSTVSIMFLVSLLKMPWCQGWFGSKSPLIKRALITTLGLASGVMLVILGGVAWPEALFAGLFSSQGAMSLFEVWKGVIRPKK